MRNRFVIMILLLASLWLVACGGAAPGGPPESSEEGDGGTQPEASPPAGEASPAPTEHAAEPSPTVEAAPTEEVATPPTATGGAAGGEGALIDNSVISYVAMETGVAESEVEIVSREAVEWPDSAMGCPQEGMMYSELIVPGYRYEVSVAGESLAVHTDETGGTIISCTEGEEPEMGDPAEEGEGMSGTLPEGLAEQALALLAQETGLPETDFTLQGATAVNWRDSSLGCPQPDMMYMQVITPGYQLIFEGNGESFYVHTDEMGSLLIVCENPEEPAG